MRPSRPITWARLRVYFAILLLVLFALGLLLLYASTLADRTGGQDRLVLRNMGVTLLALPSSPASPLES